MDVVLLALNAWGAFGQVYAEWRTPWESKSKAYAEERALTFTHLASKLSVAMKAVSLSKHKSWYAFLTAWLFTAIFGRTAHRRLSNGVHV